MPIDVVVELGGRGGVVDEAGGAVGQGCAGCASMGGRNGLINGI